jgi:DtxR family Mn-dependent transcriptional regulator
MARGIVTRGVARGVAARADAAARSRSSHGSRILSATSEPAVSAAAQDFLKAILELERSDGKATTNGLAERLAVSAPTVTAMAKRLDEAGLVKRAPYRGVTLTERGRLVALEVLRHHRLLERYLVDTLGMPLDEVHGEADRLEHVLSEALEQRIDEALGYPTHDPHGDPIPDRELRLAPQGDRRTIADLGPGERATVATVPDHDPALLRYLGELGLVPSSELTAVAAAPFDGPVTLETASGRHAVSRELAASIGVD